MPQDFSHQFWMIYKNDSLGRKIGEFRPKAEVCITKLTIVVAANKLNFSLSNAIRESGSVITTNA